MSSSSIEISSYEEMNFVIRLKNLTKDELYSMLVRNKMTCDRLLESNTTILNKIKLSALLMRDGSFILSETIRREQQIINKEI